ncbi:hypothetical protein HDE_11487 [Halotydeus destructor]|nr:hypothetical protein HDE_11487 [Halotydeus destructor]
MNSFFTFETASGNPVSFSQAAISASASQLAGKKQNYASKRKIKPQSDENSFSGGDVAHHGIAKYSYSGKLSGRNRGAAMFESKRDVLGQVVQNVDHRTRNGDLVQEYPYDLDIKYFNNMRQPQIMAKEFKYQPRLTSPSQESQVELHEMFSDESRRPIRSRLLQPLIVKINLAKFTADGELKRQFEAKPFMAKKKR